MVILITGGTGFIGRNLVEQLKLGHEILAPSRKELDLLDEEAVRSFFRIHPVDVVIHSAATPGHRNAPPVPDLAVRNLRMFLSLARNCGRYRKMLFLSSGAVYDMRHYRPKMTEDYFDTYIPQDQHGFSKYMCAKYIEQARDIVELRLFGVFGKYEDYAIRFISNAICKAIMDLPITINQNRRFDYLFVEDLGKIVDYFIRRDPPHKAYNVAPDEATDLRSLAEMVRRVSGKQVDICVREAGLGSEYSGDNSRLRAFMPGLMLTPVAESIPRLYAWYEQHKGSIKKELLLFDK